MGVNIDEILASLEQEKTAEANFADNLNSEETPTESNEPTVSEEAVEETVEDTNVEMTEDDMAKIAAECDAQGRVMARAFVSEINKIAADTYETDESGEATPEEAPEEPIEATEEAPAVEETVEEEKVAEEFTPEEKILGQLYNNYFGGNENE
jgi:hypothetical protein